MLKLETKADLDRLVADRIPEGLTLEYKASPALSRDPKNITELTKDVSAFANSAGGQVIYGMSEDKETKVAGGLDGGVDGAAFSHEWLEQILTSRIQPRIDGLVIKAVPIEQGRFAYVVTIPQAETKAPHQADDKRYYRRHNFKAQAMEDYEIRDVLNRSQNPDPSIELGLANTLGVEVKWPEEKSYSDPVLLYGTAGNNSNVPAYYSVIKLFFDHELKVDVPQFTNQGLGYPFGRPAYVFIRNMGIPGDFPLFKETRFLLTTTPIKIQIPEKYRNSTVVIFIGFSIHTPGKSHQQLGELLYTQNRISLRWHKYPATGA